MDASLVLTLVEKLLQVLDSPISKEIQFVFCYASHLKKLRHTVSTIEAVLVNVEQQERLKLPTSVSRFTLDRLKEAIYEADDLFDEIATIAQRKKLSGNDKVCQEVRLFFSRFNHFYYAFTKSREIKKIRETLDAIANDHRDFGSMQGQVPTFEVGNHSRETHSFVPEDEVIGRDEDKQKLIDILLDSTPVEEALSVVSIVGIGGLGKTTLARCVYNDSRIQREFKLKMWVCVSDDFNVQAILCNILAEATKNPVDSNVSMEHLRGKIEQSLEGHKYLLVLDDIWNEDPERWDVLRTLLIQVGRGSRIIVTTRSRRVAQIVGSCHTHVLEGLSDEDSWKLFEKMTLKPGQVQLQAHLVDIGKVIVRKCANVPLAIRVIGRLLQVEGEYMWQNLKHTDLASLKLDENGAMIPVLKISYNYLPSHLKSCFTFCAVYPKDHQIMKDDLIYLWMAQGFIMPSNGQSFEDLGEEYFEKLMQKCFFQDVKRKTNGVIKSCKMHDLIHDLAMEVAGLGIKSNSDDNNNLHIYIDDTIVQTKDAECYLTQMKRLRTCLGCGSKFIGSYTWLLKMRHLRVLDLSQDWGDEKKDLKRLPRKIGQLVHLRYLDLSYNEELFVLPNSITQLCNMQTLNLEGCKSLKELPSKIGQLVHLRYLNLSYNKELSMLPNSIMQLCNMQKLILKGCTGLEELPSKIGQLVHLRYLDLSYNEELSMLPNSITQLCNLQTLKLKGCERLEELPRELSTLVSLRHLDVRFCDKVRYMPPGMNRMTCLHKLPVFVLGGSNNHSCGAGDLEDLKYLVNLRDTIHIKMLEGWRYDATQVKEGGYLINKPLLNEIIISWNLDSVDDDNVEALLQGLQPHCNVKELSLNKYPGVKFPSWGEGDSLTVNLSKALRNLVRLHLKKCIRLKHVPWFSQLRHLKVLQLEELSELEYVESRDNGSTSSGDGVATATASAGRGTEQAHDDDLLFFPSLERLELRDLPELKGWWKPASHSNSIVAFPRLSYITIWDCPNLTTFPSLPNIEELFLHASHKALRYYDSLPRESFQHLSSLGIAYDEEIERLSTREVFRSGRLSSLRSLHFYKCRKLKSISERGGWEHFTALETLILQDLSELEMEEKEGDMPWRCLAPSLRELTLSELPKMVGKLPKGMRHLTALRSLSIQYCDNLEEIPPWISCFPSLHRLQLLNCPKVKSLPEEMRNLTFLQELELYRCSSALKERCQKGTGADWHLIQHIPTIRL